MCIEPLPTCVEGPVLYDQSPNGKHTIGNPRASVLELLSIVAPSRNQSGTKPKLVAFLIATNFGHFLLFFANKVGSFF